jgi:tetratricopeptide (TPR) repeat protein
MPHHRSWTKVRPFVAGIFALATMTGCDTLSARFRAREGVDLYHEGKYAEAASKFEEAVAKDPKLPVLKLNEGTSYLAHFRAVGGKTPEGQKAATKAISAYEEYLELKPNDDRVKGALIQTFVETARYEDAVTFFRPAVEKAPPDIEALTTLATIASKCSKPEEAEKWFQKRIDASPNKPEGYLAYGVYLWQELHDHADWPHDKRMPKAQQALDLLKKVIELQPHAPNGYSYTNLVYREMAASDPNADNKKKDLEEAARFYKLAAERQKAG